MTETRASEKVHDDEKKNDNFSADLRHVEKISELSTEIQAVIWLIYENILNLFFYSRFHQPNP